MKDIEKIINGVRTDFPILNSSVYGKPLIYLDNAATTYMPIPVVSSIAGYYSSSHSNVHRGTHYLCENATLLVEKIRKNVAGFIGARRESEIIFTSGTTHSINMAARSFCESFLSEGDNIIVSGMEHHSNFIPWQMMCAQYGAELRIIPITKYGDLNMEAFGRLLNGRTKLVAVTAVSNVLGTVNPVREIADMAHCMKAKVLVDGAQAMRHCVMDVRKMDCDMFCFSGHKMIGPTGIGVLYIRHELLDTMRPSEFGGGMVDAVMDQSVSFAEAPYRFEAGTPNIAGIIGLGAAVDYLMSIGIENIAEIEAALLSETERLLRDIEEVELLGEPQRRSGVISFNLQWIPPCDTASLLDRLGIVVRSGNHCAQPLMKRMHVPGTVRVSPAFYNTFEEIELFAEGIKKILDIAGTGNEKYRADSRGN